MPYYFKIVLDNFRPTRKITQTEKSYSSLLRGSEGRRRKFQLKSSFFSSWYQDINLLKVLPWSACYFISFILNETIFLLALYFPFFQ